jgi:hypothetical protein
MRNEANAMKGYGTAEVYLRACSTSALGKLSLSGLVALPIGKEPLDKRLDRSQSCPEHNAKEDKTLFLPGFELR